MHACEGWPIGSCNVQVWAANGFPITTCICQIWAGPQEGFIGKSGISEKFLEFVILCNICQFIDFLEITRFLRILNLAAARALFRKYARYLEVPKESRICQISVVEIPAMLFWLRPEEQFIILVSSACQNVHLPGIH